MAAAPAVVIDEVDRVGRVQRVEWVEHRVIAARLAAVNGLSRERPAGRPVFWPGWCCFLLALEQREELLEHGVSSGCFPLPALSNRQKEMFGVVLPRLSRC